MMKKLSISLALFLACASAQAATILIDFEEVTPQDVFGGGLTVESKGFTFEAGTFLASPPSAGVGPGGISSDAECFAFGSGCGAFVTMEASDSSAFGILSIGSSQGFFSGTLVGGGSADLTTPMGSGDWLNLEGFRISAECSTPFGCGSFTALLDDITVSAVPVPAAVWLFGSALAGLGWLRRR